MPSFWYFPTSRTRNRFIFYLALLKAILAFLFGKVWLHTPVTHNTLIQTHNPYPSPTYCVYSKNWKSTINNTTVQRTTTAARWVSAIYSYAPFWRNWLFFFKYEMADYFAHFHEKFILKKSIYLCNSRNKISYGHIDFPGLAPGLAKKVICTTYR